MIALLKALCLSSLFKAKHPRDLYFLVVVAGKAGHNQKRMNLGGLAAPGTLWVNHPGRATA